MRKGTGGKVSTWTTSPLKCRRGEGLINLALQALVVWNVLLLRLCCLSAGHLCATNVLKALLHLKAVLKRSSHR